MVFCVDRLTRLKRFNAESVTKSELARRLNALDLTSLGVGSTLGVGVYLLIGPVAQSVAGPAIVLSLIIAGLAAALSGLCYAEFGARVPRAGTAYVYSFVTLGEVWAFVIGWNLILEYVIGTAAIAHAFSKYIDLMSGEEMSSSLASLMPITIGGVTSYPDFLAFGITLVVTCVLCLCVKPSSFVNMVLLGMGLLAVVYALICGLFKLNGHNWALDQKEIPIGRGVGGFFPYGADGMFAGAALCFYAFLGFDVIAAAGEETEEPHRNIPLSILLTIAINFLLYFLVSSMLTLMVPYYAIDGHAALTSAFGFVGWTSVASVVSAGSVVALLSSLLSTMFPIPRIVYAMANDGLIFRFLGSVNGRVKTPVIATLISGLLTGIVAMFLELHEGLQMMAIGTLLAYTIVSICVILARYDSRDSLLRTDIQLRPDDQEESSTASCGTKCFYFTPVMLFVSDEEKPTALTSAVVKLSVLLTVISMCGLDAMLVFVFENHSAPDLWVWFSLVFCILLVILLLIIIWRQPQNSETLTFKVPFVPVLPMLSVFVNIYLIMKLSPLTWLRFSLWTVIGLVVYFLYGIWNSSAEVDSVAEEEGVEPSTFLDRTNPFKDDESNPFKDDDDTTLVKSSPDHFVLKQEEWRGRRKAATPLQED